MVLDKLTLGRLRKTLGLYFFMERHKLSVRTKYIALKSGISDANLERLELGKGCHLSHYQRLLAFYGKKVKIELVDKDD